MTENYLVKLLEHNNWANIQIIQACSVLSDEQPDADPQSAAPGSIRRTLSHLVGSQQGYLSLLTLPVEERFDVPPRHSASCRSPPASAEVGWCSWQETQPGKLLKSQLQTKDGYLVEPLGCHATGD